MFAHLVEVLCRLTNQSFPGKTGRVIILYKEQTDWSVQSL